MQLVLSTGGKLRSCTIEYSAGFFQIAPQKQQ